MPVKSVKMKISKNKKMRFFHISHGSFNPKIRSSKTVISSSRTETQRHTKVTTVGTLSGFQGFFPQPIIKDRSNMLVNA